MVGPRGRLGAGRLVALWTGAVVSAMESNMTKPDKAPDLVAVMRKLHGEALSPDGHEGPLARLIRLAADEIERLRGLTANHIGFDDERTGKRIRLYAPDLNSFEVAVYDPVMNDMLRDVHRQVGAAGGVGTDNPPWSPRPKRDVADILRDLEGEAP